MAARRGTGSTVSARGLSFVGLPLPGRDASIGVAMVKVISLRLMQIWGSIYRCGWLECRQSLEVFHCQASGVLASTVSDKGKWRGGREVVGQWPVGPGRCFGGWQAASQ
jgi:hypothetical protein